MISNCLPPFAVDATLALVLVDMADTDDRAEIVDDIDSIDGFLPPRLGDSDGLLGGREGGGGLAPLLLDGRGGKAGTAAGDLGRGTITVGVSEETAMFGWLPIGREVVVPLFNTGGLFVDWLRRAGSGLCPGGGGGGGLFFFVATDS